MAAIIRPSQEDGLTEDTDACWSINDDNDSIWDRQPSNLHLCARIRMPLEEDLAELSSRCDLGVSLRSSRQSTSQKGLQRRLLHVDLVPLQRRLIQR